MDYSELQEKFWEYNKKRPLGATCMAFYLLLLKIWKDKSGSDFTLTNKEICRILKITERTIVPTKEKLRNFGLISYQTPEKPKIGVGTIYKIIYDYSFTAESKKEKSIKQTAINNEQLKINQKNKLAAELLQNPKSNIQNPNPNGNIFSSAINENLSKTINKEKLDKKIPTLEEVMDYVRTLKQIYKPDMDFHIQAKYEKWVDAGWKDGHGNPIPPNWKIKFKNVMPYIKSTPQNNSGLQPRIEPINQRKIELL